MHTYQDQNCHSHSKVNSVYQTRQGYLEESNLSTLNQIFNKKKNVKKTNSKNSLHQVKISETNNNQYHKQQFSSKNIWSDKEEQKRYKQIAAHLTKQNRNLKQHRDFLIQETNKYRIKLKKMKQIVSSHQNKMRQLKEENQIYKIQYQQLQEYVFQKNSSDLNSFIKLNSTIETPISGLYEPKLNLNNNHNELEILNEKFQAAMYQYKKNKTIESRKTCIQVAKQIKQLKEPFKLANQVTVQEGKDKQNKCNINYNINKSNRKQQYIDLNESEGGFQLEQKPINKKMMNFQHLNNKGNLYNR